MGWGAAGVGVLTLSPPRIQHPIGLEMGDSFWGGGGKGGGLTPFPRQAGSGGSAGRGSEGRVNPVPTQVPAPQWGCRWGGGGGRCVWGLGEGMIHCG